MIKNFMSLVSLSLSELAINHAISFRVAALEMCNLHVPYYTTTVFLHGNKYPKQFYYFAKTERRSFK